MRRRLAATGLTVETTLDCANALVVTAPASDSRARTKLASIVGVTAIEPDNPYPAPRVTSRPLAKPSSAVHARQDSAPNDEFLSEQWNLQLIQAMTAWDYTTGAADALTTVAILDTGIDMDHPDLAGNVFTEAAWNFPDNNNDIQDTSYTGSGSMVAGIIAATANNGFAVAGLSWNTQLIPIKVISRHPTTGEDIFYWSHVIAGLCRAVNKGANVIQISAYHRVLDSGSAMFSALSYAEAHGAVVVAPVGDEKQTGNPIEYPAAYQRLVIGVGGVDERLNVWEHSNSGSYVAVVAPAVDVATTVPMSLDTIGARRGTGTILAAAHVTGLAVLIRSINPTLSPREVADIIRRTADDIGMSGPDLLSGTGVINARKAVENTPHRLTLSPSDLLVFEWDTLSQSYRQPNQSVSNNLTGARTWRTQTTAEWLNVTNPVSAAAIGSTPSIASITVAPPREGECGTRAGYVRAESAMMIRANGPQSILVRVFLPECARAPYSLYFPLVSIKPPRPVTGAGR